MQWTQYNVDKHSTTLEAGSYLCRLEYPDGRVRYRVKQFYVFGNGTKRGYFASNGKAYTITHYTTIIGPNIKPNALNNQKE